MCGQPLLGPGESEQETYRMSGPGGKAHTLPDTEGSSLAMQLRREVALPGLLAEQCVLVLQMVLSLVIACPGCT